MSLFLEANQAADGLFQDVLRRKDRADATRNALGVLHRFKFLFNLPCNLERNIKKVSYVLCNQTKDIKMVREMGVLGWISGLRMCSVPTLSAIRNIYEVYILVTELCLNQYSSAPLIRPPCLPRNCGHIREVVLVAAAKVMAALGIGAFVEWSLREGPL